MSSYKKNQIESRNKSDLKNKKNLFFFDYQGDLPNLRQVLFVASLFGTLLQGAYLSIARISWILIAFLFTIDKKLILYSCFFFCAFFHSSGFAPNFIFTLKHFHIALSLGCMAYLFQKNFIYRRQLLEKIFSYYFPFLLIVTIGLLNYIRVAPTLTSIRVPLNIMLILICSSLLTYILCENAVSKSNTHPVLEKCVLFFCVGIEVQIILGFVNYLFETNYLSITILHNNHMGILSVLGLFYTLSGFKLSRDNFGLKCFYLILIGTFLTSILFSCSRTSWISFALASTFYFYYQKIHIANFTLKDFLSFPKTSRVLFSIVLGCVIGFSMLNHKIYDRVINMDQLISPSYWQYILADKQNFGCFGIYRLRDLQNTFEVLKTNPLIGVGFTREVVDIHGFFFLLLSASGIMGLLTCFYFGARLLKKFLHYLTVKAKSESEQYLALACLSTIIAWILICFMESYFLQFSLWINLSILIFLLEKENIAIDSTRKEMLRND